MNVRLTHLDGKLPNLALMKLSEAHKQLGNTVHFSHSIYPTLDEPKLYDRVYASCIFKFSQPLIDLFKKQWPDGIIGGTGSDNWKTVEQLIGQEYEHYDYSIYPTFTPSIGFTQRGCRLSCKFCVVPKKEGKPRSVNTIDQIWRGGPHERNIILLDNDFFGQTEWRERVEELKSFKVNFCQGINVRMITDESAEAIASLKYYDTKFKNRRIYTAWDNLRDESSFLYGISKLQCAGIPPHHIMVYMLIGYDPTETWERIMYRYKKMKEIGLLPYPMVYNNKNKELKRFQKWVVMRYDEIVPWNEFKRRA